LPTEIRSDGCHALPQARCMDDFTDDDLFLNAVDTIVLDVLQRLGGHPETRLRFFRRPLVFVQ